jgi:hypothetical protein
MKHPIILKVVLFCGLNFFFIIQIVYGQDYRNIALNPGDVHLALDASPSKFPHATSNSEYPGDGSDSSFWALNAIDGKIDNKGHGKLFPSWGPEKRADLWWKVDFGQLVATDKVVIYIRADFTPHTATDHDGYWVSGTLNFSDGTSENITFKRTADPQVFTFKPRSTTYLLINNLKEVGPPSWCSFTEVEVWGKKK